MAVIPRCRVRSSFPAGWCVTLGRDGFGQPGVLAAYERFDDKRGLLLRPFAPPVLLLPAWEATPSLPRLLSHSFFSVTCLRLPIQLY